jgi:hypothetical protein
MLPEACWKTGEPLAVELVGDACLLYELPQLLHVMSGLAVVVKMLQKVVVERADQPVPLLDTVDLLCPRSFHRKVQSNLVLLCETRVSPMHGG